MNTDRSGATLAHKLIVFTALTGGVGLGVSGSATSGALCLLLLVIGSAGLARLTMLRRRIQILTPPDAVRQSIGDAFLVASGHRRDAR